jgi:DNA-binding response OmpR family regulator
VRPIGAFAPEGYFVTVFIVEDDRGVSDSLSLVVEQLGYRALACSTAEDFIEQALPTGSDTLIVDLGLPGISGKSLIRWAQRLADPPRIVAISGQPQHMISSITRDLTLDSLLRKPLSSDAIAAAL